MMDSRPPQNPNDSSAPRIPSLGEAEDDRRRLQAIMDSCTAVIYLKDSQGRYLYINRRYEELFGLSRETILGKTDLDIFPRDFAEAFRANDRIVLEADRAMEWEEKAPHPDGPHIYFSLKFPLKDAQGRLEGLCGISSDITAYRRLEEEHNRFFDLTLDLLCLADERGFFVRLNPAWETTLGWSRADLQSRPFIDFVHPDDREATAQEAARLQDPHYTTTWFENRYRCADGSYKWLLWNAQPHPERGLVYAAARDITARKEAERQAAAHAAELENAYERTRKLAGELERAIASEREAHFRLKRTTSQMIQTEKMATLGQIAAGVAHEINNPLTSVLTNLAVLERDLGGLRKLLERYQTADRLLSPDNPVVFQPIHQMAEELDTSYVLDNLSGVLDRSRDNLQRIRRIVRDLAELDRGSGGAWHSVDLNTGIQAILGLFRMQAERKDVEVRTELAPLPTMQCHPSRLNQVVLNLLTNALEACKPGGKILLRTRADRDRVEIHVEDDGGGITPETLTRIFDPFFTTRELGQGTGLGLSTALAIVQEHGGSIEVDSVPGKGSHFTVLLPLRGREGDEKKAGTER